MIDINPFSFPPGNHTLAVTFVDERGNVGSTQYSFTGQTREGETSIECLAGDDYRTNCFQLSPSAWLEESLWT